MGRLDCTDNECSATCSVIGYNHVLTFDGTPYDFDVGDNGCSYRLVQVDIPAIVCLLYRVPLKGTFLFEEKLHNS
ncbi:hypothetical protein DPMN_060897 [Dreissena polymorpha]|uniref:VWFD domain-containing protein n=1 Tax=Dreissena polymorpha TaxID=45954 RepID=A0A9D4HHZ4_DREPO|nr:hypothetical protein DPMN_060897 [Dreissena polymorpha]